MTPACRSRAGRIPTLWDIDRDDIRASHHYAICAARQHRHHYALYRVASVLNSCPPAMGVMIDSSLKIGTPTTIMLMGILLLTTTSSDSTTATPSRISGSSSKRFLLVWQFLLIPAGVAFALTKLAAGLPFGWRSIAVARRDRRLRRHPVRPASPHRVGHGALLHEEPGSGAGIGPEPRAGQRVPGRRGPEPLPACGDRGQLARGGPDPAHVGNVVLAMPAAEPGAPAAVRPDAARRRDRGGG